MEVYSLTQVGGMADIGCYGVFSSQEKAIEYAIAFAKSNSKSSTEALIWDGHTKMVFCGEYEFEIWVHYIDDPER